MPETNDVPRNDRSDERTRQLVLGVGFVAVKLWLPAADLYRVGLAALQWPAHAAHALLAGAPAPSLGRAQLAMDASDLVALPALLVPAWLTASTAAQRAPAVQA